MNDAAPIVLELGATRLPVGVVGSTEPQTVVFEVWVDSNDLLLPDDVDERVSSAAIDSGCQVGDIGPWEVVEGLAPLPGHPHGLLKVRAVFNDFRRRVVSPPSHSPSGRIEYDHRS